jgi:outer membrane receptor protein involved in Fe transport
MAVSNARRRTILLGSSMLCAVGLTLSAPALAQNAPNAQATTQAATAPTDVDTKGTGEIVVTGSRIAREGFNAPTPVSVVNSNDIKLSGNVNIEKTLAEMPQAVASALGSAMSNTVPGGFADVNLRGFGSTRNLVLVNGRRFAIYGPEQVTDLNTIPSTLIERTEIVTGGSSAVYGSDAITGVINFIMRQNFEGLEGRAQVNIDGATGTPVYNADLTVGGNFSEGRGNVAVSANYLNRGAVTRGKRGDYAYDSLSDGCINPGSGNDNHAGTPFAANPGVAGCTAAGGQLGFIASGSGDIPNGRFSGIPNFGAANSNPALNAAYAAAGLGALGGRGFTWDTTGKNARPALTPQDDFNLGPDNYLVQPQKRWMINAFSHYDIVPGITAYMELHYSSNIVDARLAPTNVGAPTLFNINNPYLNPQMQEVFHQLDLAETTTSNVTSGTLTLTNKPNDGLALLTAGRRYVEVGPRLASEHRNVFRGAWGLRGDIGSASDDFLTGLHYDVYYTYANSEDVLQLSNAISRSRLQTALLSQNGAAPVCDIFGANVTTACATAIAISATNTTTATQQVAQGSITGDLFKLPAGGAGFSLGVEWRDTSAVFRPDSFLASGDVAGFNPGLPTSGSVSVKEFFGELRVPVLHDTPGFHELTFNGAFRYSDYSLSGIGGVWTYSLGGEWQPVSDLTIRGQYQRAIRAPNVNELFGGVTRSVPTANDPCSNRAPVAQQTDATKAVCIATGVPAANVYTATVQPNAFFAADFGGNPNLHAEQSDTYTMGAVFTPHFVPRLYLSVDYFNIALNGAIAPLGGGLQNTLNLCYVILKDPNSDYCKAVNRNPATGEINDPYVVKILNANTGQLKTSGLDFGLRYHLPIGALLSAMHSSIDLSSNYTYLYEFTATPVAAFPNIKNYCAGSFGPTCGQPLPNFRGISRLTLNLDDISISLRHRYIGPVTTDRYIVPLRQGSTATPALNTIVYPNLPAVNYFDVSFDAKVGKRLEMFGGANNVFGLQPPVTTQGPNANTFSATYDVLGVEFFLGATLRF